ncbi:MAG TPA: hypothetical protein VIM35_08635 [Gallionella sp.]
MILTTPVQATEITGMIRAARIFRALLMVKIALYRNRLFFSVDSVFSDITTGETTSHPTKQPEDGCQVVGYSHATRLAKSTSQVAGYVAN